MNTAQKVNQMDIIDTAIAAGAFTTLAKALTEADLVAVLKQEGPYTVFAPTDDAFKQLPPGTLASLLQDKAKLKKVLLYHVVAGAVKAEDTLKLKQAMSAAGQALKIAVTSAGVKINNANVIKSDVHATNGIIHVIDSVLIPICSRGMD